MKKHDLSAIQTAAKNVATLELLFAHSERRESWLTFDACGIHADFSRQLIDQELLAQLRIFAETVGVRTKIEQMFQGVIVNATESRAVMHVALRDSEDSSDQSIDARVQRERAYELAQKVRASKDIDAVINIGIGGSDLGPAMATRALRRFHDGPIVRFVSNVDPADFDSAVEGLDPARTVFVVSSKTFTTVETMHNAARAKAWVQSAVSHWSSQFIAATSNPTVATQWGIEPDNCLEFYDWVGGRFSVASVIGFPLMCSIGPNRFKEFLEGMHQMDQHVLNSEIHTNIACMHALVWFANSSVYGFPTVAVIPYSHDLGRLPAFLQQLVMESNGKSVDLDGGAIETSSPVVWGEPGTNGQHAFFQMLHQGTQIVPVEFIGSVEPMGNDPKAHDLLVANMIAQSEALAVGSINSDGHRNFPGNRPSTVLMLQQLDPFHLGALVSMYEHSTAIQGWLFGVNSFDQFGVELGKSLAVSTSNAIDMDEVDNSLTMTHPLMRWYLQARKNFISQ